MNHKCLEFHQSVEFCNWQHLAYLLQCRGPSTKMQTSLYPLVAQDCITISGHPPVILLQYHDDHVEPFVRHVVILDVLGQCFEMFSIAGELLNQEARGKSQRPTRPGYNRNRGDRRDRHIGPCYNCGEEGHLRHNFPLNYYGSPPKVDNSWCCCP